MDIAVKVMHVLLALKPDNYAAKAAKIYADAYKTDPRFYKMTRTLESYGRFLDEQTTVVLSSDAQLLRLFSEGSAP